MCSHLFLLRLWLPAMGLADLSAQRVAVILSQSSFLLLSAHYLILSQAEPGNILLSLSSTALHPLPPWRRQKQNKRIMNQTFPFSLCPLTSPSHFLQRPISAFSLLFVWDVTGAVPLCSASRGVWLAPFGVSGSSAPGKADRAPLAPSASSKRMSARSLAR